MATFRKYTFDLSFDEPRTKAEPDEEGRGLSDDGRDPDETDDGDAPPAEPPPPPPSFTEDDIQIARDQAYEEGRAAGYREAEDSQKAQIAASMAMAAEEVRGLAAQQDAANDARARNAVRVAMAVVAKMLPAAARNNAVGEIEAVVTECMTHLLDEPRVIVRCAESLAEPVREHCNQMANSVGFEGRVVVHPDARLPPGDCRVEWADGGAERTQEKLWQEIQAIIERALEPAPDMADPARPDEPAPQDEGKES